MYSALLKATMLKISEGKPPVDREAQMCAKRARVAQLIKNNSGG